MLKHRFMICTCDYKTILVFGLLVDGLVWFGLVYFILFCVRVFFSLFFALTNHILCVLVLANNLIYSHRVVQLKVFR